MPFLPKGAEWIIILIAVLLIFGPKNLPKLGSALGKTVSNLRAGMNEGKKKDKKNSEEDDAASSQPAELEGEVEEVIDQDDIEDARAEEADDSDAARDVDIEADAAAADEAVTDGSDDSDAEGEKVAEAESTDAPKKVRRVVKKVPSK